ncbi:MAG: hypothetical protein QOJ15_6451 [Bradyrhizobium sp.]|jgi:hypothetical protein|nr:hypothetical protein [Bradyrhizobium sp.]
MPAIVVVMLRLCNPKTDPAAAHLSDTHSTGKVMGGQLVKFHLDRELRLHTEPEHKTLYRWAINEIDAQGQKIGSDQIPWEWSLYFTATSCVLSDSIEISQPLNFKFKATNQDGTVTEQKSSDGKETIDQRQIIRVWLRSGDEDNSRHTTYSMFGTDRTIKDIRLDINQLTDPAEPERCIAWGCVSYTSEGVDFIDETTDDCIVFYFSVKPETFARYAAKIAHGSVDGIVLRVKSVDGFYSDWSPSVRTDKVMVLTRDDEHKVTAPSDTQLVPPRLGRVGDAALFINRRLEFGIQASEPMPDDREPKVLREKMRAVRETPAQTVVDQQVLPMLRSLRRATWFAVCLLALMFIVTLLRH